MKTAASPEFRAAIRQGEVVTDELELDADHVRREYPEALFE